MCIIEPFMQINLSEELSIILGYARDEAMRTGSYAIETDHLLLALLRHGENDACRVLKSYGVDLDEFKRFVDERIFHKQGIPYFDEDKITLSRGAQNTINLSVLEASMDNVAQACPVHLLLAISRSCGCVSETYLKEEGLDHHSLSELVHSVREETKTGAAAAEEALLRDCCKKKRIHQLK